MSVASSNVIPLKTTSSKVSLKEISLNSNVSHEIAVFSMITALNIPLNTLDHEVIVGAETVYPKSSFEIVGDIEYTKKSSVAINFLNQHRGMDVLLALVEYKIIDYFGNVPMYLELLDEERLSLFVGLTCTPEESLTKLYKFYDDWWIDNAYLAKGRLNIDVIPI